MRDGSAEYIDAIACQLGALKSASVRFGSSEDSPQFAPYLAFMSSEVGRLVRSGSARSASCSLICRSAKARRLVGSIAASQASRMSFTVGSHESLAGRPSTGWVTSVMISSGKRASEAAMAAT